MGADGMSDDKMVKISGTENATDIYYTTAFTVLTANSNPKVAFTTKLTRTSTVKIRQRLRHCHTIPFI